MNVVTEVNAASEPVLPPSRHKFLIIGCGLAGLAVAIGIRRAGHEVKILEKAAEITEVGSKARSAPTLRHCVLTRIRCISWVLVLHSPPSLQSF